MSKKINDFKMKQRELEDIIVWFESDDVDLDKAIEKYERGLELAEELKKRLESTENRIEEIRLKHKDLSETTDSLAADE